MERFNDLVNEMAEDKGLSKDWVMGYFHVSIMAISESHVVVDRLS